MALDAVWTFGTFNITYRTVQVFVWVSESATLYILTQSWLKSFAAPGRRVARGRTQSAPEWWMCVLGPVFRTEDLYVYVSSITIRCLMGKTIKITNCTYFSLSVKDVNTRKQDRLPSPLQTQETKPVCYHRHTFVKYIKCLLVTWLCGSHNFPLCNSTLTSVLWNNSITTHRLLERL